MKYLLSFVLLFSVLFASAQKMHVVSLAKKELKLAEQSYCIAEVVDGREDKSHIGWVRSGLRNKFQWATFHQPFEQEMLHFFSNKTPAAPGHQQVLVRVNQLQVSEQYKLTVEQGIANVMLDFFLKENDGSYSYISSTYGLTETSGGDVTLRHAENLADALAMAIDHFNEKGATTLVNHAQRFSLVDIKNGAMIAIDYYQIPVYKASVLKDGIYYTFEDFRDHLPDDTEDYKIKTGKKVKVWKSNPQTGGRERIKEGVYAVVKNSRPYIFFQDGFYPLKRDEFGFYFTGPVVRNMDLLNKGLLIGGMAGVAAVAASSGKRKDYAIDLSSGGVFEIGDLLR